MPVKEAASRFYLLLPKNPHEDSTAFSFLRESCSKSGTVPNGTKPTEDSAILKLGGLFWRTCRASSLAIKEEIL